MNSILLIFFIFNFDNNENLLQNPGKSKKDSQRKKNKNIKEPQKNYIKKRKKNFHIILAFH